MTYELRYLSAAISDMTEAVRYIRQELQNPTAAERLSQAFLAGTQRLAQLPYSCPIHYPLRPLAHEYRKLLIGNYLMFYRVDEEKKLVTVVRVIYARRNLDNPLE